MAVETWRYHKAGKAKGKFRCVEKSVWRPTQRTVGTTATAAPPSAWAEGRRRSPHRPSRARPPWRSRRKEGGEMSLQRAFLSRVSSSSLGLFRDSRNWARRERGEVEEAAEEIDGGGRDGALVVTGGEEEEEEGGRWERMPPELIGEIVQRVEAGGERWPLRKDVVSCACLCRRWREVTRGVVRPPLETGKITFPSSLKEVTGCPSS
ncbi:hypothetical protein BHM03_00031026 [Ensete ventricosum]|nr:hypothetical protein BHM03_00031026 [Ensete ventricosum]